MTTLKLVNIEKLADELQSRGIEGVSVGMLRHLKARRLISHVKLGHRTLRFDPDRVAAEIESLTVQPTGASRRPSGIGVSKLN